MSDARKLVCSEATLNSALTALLDTLISEESGAVTVGMGRLLRGGQLDSVNQCIAEEHKIILRPGVDVFGEALFKKPNYECECPKCKRTLAAARFAPHLEKCMGMGRNSSRIASRRLAAAASNTQQQQMEARAGVGGQVNGEVGSEEEPASEEEDEEWTMERRKKGRGRRKWPLPRSNCNRKPTSSDGSAAALDE